MIKFFVPGNPVPKQSFRYAKTGGYTKPHVKAWQETVAMYARQNADKPLEGFIGVTLIFYLPDCRRKDWDNLSKAVMDGMNGIVYHDDSQVIEAQVIKKFTPPIDNDFGVSIEVRQVKG